MSKFNLATNPKAAAALALSKTNTVLANQFAKEAGLTLDEILASVQPDNVLLETPTERGEQLRSPPIAASTTRTASPQAQAQAFNQQQQQQQTAEAIEEDIEPQPEPQQPPPEEPDQNRPTSPDLLDGIDNDTAKTDFSAFDEAAENYDEDFTAEAAGEALGDTGTNTLLAPPVFRQERLQTEPIDPKYWPRTQALDLEAEKLSLPGETLLKLEPNPEARSHRPLFRDKKGNLNISGKGEQVQLKDKRGKPVEDTPVLAKQDLKDPNGKTISLNQQLVNAQETYDFQDQGVPNVNLKRVIKSSADLDRSIGEATRRAGVDVVVGLSTKANFGDHTIFDAMKRIREGLSDRIEKQQTMVGSHSLSDVLKVKYGTNNVVELSNAMAMSMAGMLDQLKTAEQYLAADNAVDESLVVPARTLDLSGMTVAEAAGLFDALLLTLLPSKITDEIPEGLDVQPSSLILLDVLQSTGYLAPRESSVSGETMLVATSEFTKLYKDLRLLKEALFTQLYLDESGEYTSFRSQTTPPAPAFKTIDGELVATTPSWTGKAKHQRKGNEIVRAKDIPLPNQIIEMNTMLTQVPHYADPSITTFFEAQTQALDSFVESLGGTELDVNDPDVDTAIEEATSRALRKRNDEGLWEIVKDATGNAILNPKYNYLVAQAISQLDLSKRGLKSVGGSPRNTFMDPNSFAAYLEMQSFDGDKLSYAIWNTNIVKALKKAALDKKPRYNVYRTDMTNYRQSIDGGEFNISSLTARAISTNSPSKIIPTNGKVSNNVVQRFKVGSEPIMTSKEVSNMRSWGEGKTSKNGVLAEPTGDQKLQLALISLAKNLVRRSRGVLAETAITDLTGDFLKSKANDAIAIQAASDREAYLERLQLNNEARTQESGRRSLKREFSKNQALRELSKQSANNDDVKMIHRAVAGSSNIHQAAEIYGQYLLSKMPRKTIGLEMRAHRAAEGLVEQLQPLTWNPASRNVEVGSKPITTWIHNLTTEMDQTSAGRMFIAAESGRDDVLRRGAYSDVEDAALQDFMFKDGSPRTHAVETFLEIFKDQEPKATSTVGSAYKKGVRDAVNNFREGIKAIDLQRAEGRLDVQAAEHNLGLVKSFDDWLMKNPLLTKDYGEAIQSNDGSVSSMLKKMDASEGTPESSIKGLRAEVGDVAYDALFSKFQKELSDTFGRANDPSIKAATLDEMLLETLEAVIDEWTSAVPKEITKTLAYLNLLPEGKGAFNEDLNIGQMGMIYKVADSEYITYQDADGKTWTQPIIIGELGRTASARSKKKTSEVAYIVKQHKAAELGVEAGTVLAVKNKKTGEITYAKDIKPNSKNPDHKITQKELKTAIDNPEAVQVQPFKFYDAGPGTRASSGVGPALGQQSETVFFAYGTALMQKRAPWLQSQPDFYIDYMYDNIRADPMTAWLWEVNAKQIMLETMNVNKTADFVRLNKLRLEQELKLLDRDKEVEVGLNSQYHILAEHLDKRATEYAEMWKVAQDPKTEQDIKSPAISSRANEIATAYKGGDGIWAPKETMKVSWYDNKGNRIDKILKGRDGTYATKKVSGDILADFIRSQFMRNLDRKITTNTKKTIKRWEQFEDAASSRKPDQIRKMIDRFGLFLAGGLD